MQNITLLGATGSIGQSTLSILAAHRDQYQVFAIAAYSNVDGIFSCCQQWEPSFAVMTNPQSAEALALKLREAKINTEVLAGEEGLVQVSQHPDTQIVVAAMVGAAGLVPTIAAAYAGKRICLANKEALVMGGKLLMQAVEAGGATLIPVDSEHNALFQAMPPSYRCGQRPAGVERLILTASGGPFRALPVTELHQVSPAQAIAHPNWSMGPKVSVDSATMMNKGLELIEAHWLFNMPCAKIEVLIHPQSIIHSLVEYEDGSQLAQLGVPDMRTPIACALSWPERISSGVPRLNLADKRQLTFESPDFQRFPCLRLAFNAIEQGGAAPTILNAANEVAVKAFLEEKIPYLSIPKLIDQALTEIPTSHPIDSVEALYTVDAQTREYLQHSLPRQ